MKLLGRVKGTCISKAFALVKPDINILIIFCWYIFDAFLIINCNKKNFHTEFMNILIFTAAPWKSMISVEYHLSVHFIENVTIIGTIRIHSWSAAREYKLSFKHYDKILLLSIFRYIYNISICVGNFKSRYPPIPQIQHFL